MKQWNPNAIWFNEIPEEHTHPAVRRTSYMEVHKLIGTSGCSNSPELWQWSVLGVMDTPRGKLVVYPGDWIGKLNNGQYFIVPKLEDDKFLMEMGHSDLVNLIAGYQLSKYQQGLPGIDKLLCVDKHEVFDWHRPTLESLNISQLIEIHQLLWSVE